MAAKVMSESRKQKVYNVLKARKWTPGTVITKPSTGGSEGLRRLRELREDGYVIKTRRMAGSSQYEYRLTGKK